MIARSAAGGVDESINLDVVALEELKKKATPTTNDLPKYNYQADAEGNYCKCTIVASLLPKAGSV